MQEADLIRRAQSGDSDSFSMLIETHEKRIYNVAYKFMQNEPDAQDAAQDTIIKMYTNIGKFNFKSSFLTWAYRVCANTCLDLLRKKKPDVQVEEYVNVVESKTGNPENETVNNELSRNISRCIKSLAQKYMAVLVLKDIEGMRYEEIAQILKISVGTVKSRLSRAREKVRSEMVSKGYL